MAQNHNLPALPDEVQSLPVFCQSVQEIKEVLQENLGAANLTASDLDKIKVPSGDTPMWTMQTLEGPKGVGELVGVICAVQMGRSFWASKDLSNTPPDCSSSDTISGFGRRGPEDDDGPHDCAACPQNQFGSGVDAKGMPTRGKACSEKANLFLLMGSGYLPMVVQVPATSLGAWRKYIARLSSFGKAYSAVVSKLTLNATKSKGGQAYMQIVFSSVSVLPPDKYAAVKEYAAVFGESFKRASRSEVEETPGGDDVDAPPSYEEA